MLLFEKIPKLKGVVPHLDLMIAPTPIRKLEKLGETLGLRNLYCKDEGVSGKTYGGNKVRKLEFLLADAKAGGAKRVITFGAVGSNHALATAVYCQELGLKTTVLVTPQPKTKSCRENLLCHTVIGTDLYYVAPEDFRAKKIELMEMYKKQEGNEPYVVPTGGTNELGVLGFINAALELGLQIEKGEMPPPDVIYVAGGTFGSVAGITLGLKMIRQKALVKPVRVTDPMIWSENRLHKLMNNSINFLRKKGDFHFEEHTNFPVRVVDHYFGQGYGVETKELKEIMNLVEKTEGLHLELVYTAKPMAALVDDAKNGLLKNKIVLFWKTNNSTSLDSLLQKASAEALPQNLKEYVE